MEIVEMKRLVKRKLYHVAQCIENNRLLNLRDDLENAVSMIVELSQVTNIDVTLDNLEIAIDACSCILASDRSLLGLTPMVEHGYTVRPTFIILSSIFMKISLKSQILPIC